MSTGQVNITVYYGTPYDWQNIPFHPYNIGVHAESTKNFNGVFVWQTTWLNVLRLNVSNYNDIVGAQWLKIDETDSEQFHGSHYYYILDYVQINNKTVQLSLMYDALLSLGVDNITAITGTLKRWTVDDDSDPFKFVMTSEPINQADPYEYTYETIDILSSNNNHYRLLGSPVDLTVQPEILSYQNPSGEDANIFYPELKPISAGTNFLPRYPTVVYPYTDGLAYYQWGREDTVQKNYSYAVGLGYNLVTNSYVMPQNNLVNFEYQGLQISSIAGFSRVELRNSMAGHGMTVGGYNNAKTGAIGLFFTLFNTGSGSQITAHNYELSGMGVEVWCDPGANGRFYARFATYLHDAKSTCGAVPSMGWQPLTITSSIGQGATMASVNNALDLAAAKQTQKEQSTANFENMFNGMANGIQQIGWGAAQGSPGLAVAGGVQIFSSLLFGAIHHQDIQTRYRMERQRLEIVGTITTNTPPSVTYGQISEWGRDGYIFHVRCASLSDNDRQRADEFFTAYGYNVDSLQLDNVSMLNSRKRFTYILADDVRINAGSDQTRVRDVQTMQQITERFANGIRIWQVKPDYDWTIKNEVL